MHKIFCRLLAKMLVDHQTQIACSFFPFPFSLFSVQSLSTESTGSVFAHLYCSASGNAISSVLGSVNLETILTIGCVGVPCCGCSLLHSAVMGLSLVFLQVVILDVRVPCTPVARLNNHRACVNGIAWAPHSSCHICTAGNHGGRQHQGQVTVVGEASGLKFVLFCYLFC